MQAHNSVDAVSESKKDIKQEMTVSANSDKVALIRASKHPFS